MPRLAARFDTLVVMNKNNRFYATKEALNSTGTSTLTNKSNMPNSVKKTANSTLRRIRIDPVEWAERRKKAMVSLIKSNHIKEQSMFSTINYFI